MPTTRKKVIKTVYKDDSEEETGDFSDSGSEAKISEVSSSDEDDEEACDVSSGDEFKNNKKKPSKPKAMRKPKPFAKSFINKLNKNTSVDHEDGNADDIPATFSIKDLTDADKLLPSVLNLSESDSSDDEVSKPVKKKISAPLTTTAYHPHVESESDKELDTEYKDVFSSNFQENSEEIAKKTFLELELHKTKIDETKATIQSYKNTQDNSRESNVKDLLAQGGEVASQSTLVKKKVKRRLRDESDSDMEDWEEVKENKAIPQQGLQLIVDIPDAVCRKTKKVDVEMMMKRKINRVKKEYQVYMHKVHVLCWLGHGNYVGRVLNGQELLAAALSLVPSKECYPGDRVDMKYLQQITVWYKDKISLKQDKNEDKFRPKAPPLKDVLITQIKNRVVTTKKYMVFIFISMLRALGLQCRVMFNFVTLPLKPPTSELCSLSTKPKNENKSNNDGATTSKGTVKKETTKSKPSSVKSKHSKISQIDGNFDYNSQSDSEMENLVQLDGSGDALSVQTRKTRASKMKSTQSDTNINKEDLSPSKRSGKSPTSKTVNAASKTNVSDTNSNKEDMSPPKRFRKSFSPETVKTTSKTDVDDVNINKKDAPKRSRQSLSPITVKAASKTDACPNINKDVSPPKRSRRSPNAKSVKATSKIDIDANINREDASPPKRSRKSPSPKSVKTASKTNTSAMVDITKQLIKESIAVHNNDKETHQLKKNDPEEDKNVVLVPPPRKSRNLTNTKNTNTNLIKDNLNKNKSTSKKSNVPEIVVSHSDENSVSSKYFGNESSTQNTKLRLSRKRSQTTTPATSQNSSLSLVSDGKQDKAKSRTKSTPSNSNERSKYFSDSRNKEGENKKPKLNLKSKKGKEIGDEDSQRISHRNLHKETTKSKNDVTGDLINIIKNRVKEVKEESKKGIVKGKVKLESDEDSDYLPEEVQNKHNGESDDDFKPTKISPKPSTCRRPSTNRKIDRRVLSSDEESPKNKLDVWCEVYVEELEQWISVDIMSGKLHCPEYLYSRATHPVTYVVGWDNNNYLKDLTRRYVPQWNTVTRKQRAESSWWNKAIQPWLGPKTSRDREEDENLDRMQLDAPLPKSIAEYKNHPLYALKRHLLKFEAIYPPDAATLGFVRGEPVYGRECVYTCRSRDTWLKEAKVVRLGEQPYKVVKARPKWDKLSNKLITDKPLEVFGPWQVQDYEPPVAENGIVPRNAYGNVELFKDCMLPKGTVHIKLPGLNKVARKLNIDCAPAMTGFDFNGGWSHPVYDGFVVCKEFEELVTDAWVKDQEEQERKEREKTEARVYGNWRRLIKGLFIRERLKNKYGFEDPSTSQDNKKKSTGPRFVAKKK